MKSDNEREDFMISEFLRSLGPWRKHVIIGGGQALLIYKLYLTEQNQGIFPVGTRDLDSLIPRKIPIVSNKNIGKHLIEAGFKHVFKDFRDPSTEAYVKDIHGLEMEIEFLTTDETRHNKDRNVTISGVVAQPLPYLQQSLQNTVEFKTHSGEIGRVVSPHAWIFHKGLTFFRRTDKVKIYKDLYGIWYTSSQLQALSDKTKTELQIMGKRFPKRFKLFQKKLNGWIAHATPTDWIKLESQDPFGVLKKITFIHLIRTLLVE